MIFTLIFRLHNNNICKILPHPHLILHLVPTTHYTQTVTGTTKDCRICWTIFSYWLIQLMQSIYSHRTIYVWPNHFEDTSNHIRQWLFGHILCVFLWFWMNVMFLFCFQFKAAWQHKNNENNCVVKTLIFVNMIDFNIREIDIKNDCVCFCV